MNDNTPAKLKALKNEIFIYGTENYGHIFKVLAFNLT
jgi:hypothetical protein